MEELDKFLAADREKQEAEPTWPNQPTASPAGMANRSSKLSKQPAARRRTIKALQAEKAAEKQLQQDAAIFDSQMLKKIVHDGRYELVDGQRAASRPVLISSPVQSSSRFDCPLDISGWMKKLSSGSPASSHNGIHRNAHTHHNAHPPHHPPPTMPTPTTTPMSVQGAGPAGDSEGVSAAQGLPCTNAPPCPPSTYKPQRGLLPCTERPSASGCTEKQDAHASEMQNLRIALTFQTCSIIRHVFDPSAGIHCPDTPYTSFELGSWSSQDAAQAHELLRCAAATGNAAAHEDPAIQETLEVYYGLNSCLPPWADRRCAADLRHTCFMLAQLQEVASRSSEDHERAGRLVTETFDGLAEQQVSINLRKAFIDSFPVS